MDPHRKKGDDPVTAEDRRPIRRALISVYDKTGLEPLARAVGARVRRLPVSDEERPACRGGDGAVGQRRAQHHE